jgi:hypothetical protein
VGRYTSWFIILLATLAVFFLASEYAYQAGWAIDESVAYLMAEDAIEHRFFPMRGIINSFGFHNPNALVVFTLPFALLFDHPLYVSYALILFHILSLIACLSLFHSISSAQPKHQKPTNQGFDFLILMVILTDVGLLVSAPMLWALTVIYPFLAALLFLLLATDRKANFAHHLFLGYLFLFLPALHLSLFVLLPFALWPVHRRFKDGQIASLWALLMGCLIAIALHWIPWFITVDFTQINELRESWSAGKPYEDISIVRRVFGFSQWVNLLLDPFPDDILRIVFDPLFLTASRALRLIWIIGTLLLLFICAIQSRSKSLLRLTVPPAGFAVIFSILSILGKSPYWERANIGQIFIIPLIVYMAFVTREFLCSDGIYSAQVKTRIRYAYSTFFVALIGIRLLAFSMDTSDAQNNPGTAEEAHGTFSLLDLPIGEKITILDELLILTEAHKGPPLTVAYEVEDFEIYFGYIKNLDAVTQHQFYRKNALFEFYLSRHSSNNQKYKMVDVEERPEFLILHPVYASNEIELNLGDEMVAYRKLIATESLGLWQQEQPAAAK